MLKKAFIPYKGYYSSPFARWQGPMANENAIVLGAETSNRFITGKNWDPTEFDYVILGVRTTIDFLKDVISHPQFRKGNTTTDFINKYFDGWKGKEKTEESLKLALIATAFNSLNQTEVRAGGMASRKESISPWKTLGKWRIGGKE